MATISQGALSNTFFLNKDFQISIKISPRFVPKGPGEKPLSEAMTVSLLTHTCAARPQ